MAARKKSPPSVPPPPPASVTPPSLGPSGTWHVPPWQVADFYQDVWGNDLGQVWAVGQVWGGRKGVIHSTDFGRTWAPVDRPNQHGLLAVTGDGAGNVWAVGGGGTVLRADEASGVFKRLRAGLDGSLSGIFARSPGELYVVDNAGTIFRTSDGGKTWRAVHKAPSRLRRVRGRAGGPLYAVGAPRVVFESDDGVTWRDISPPPTGAPPSAEQLDSVAIADDGTIFVGGWNGTLLRSRDGGAGWQPLPVPDVDRGMPVSDMVIDARGRLFVASFNCLLRSDDGGDSFVEEYRNPDVNLHHWHYALWMGARGDGVAVGAHGTIVVRQR